MEKFGVDIVSIPDNYENKGIGDSSWVGANVSCGVGVGVDPHVMQTETKQTKSFNPIQSIKNAFNWVKSRFKKG